MADEEVPKESNTHPWWMLWKKRRNVVCLLAFFGFFNVYALRVNLSIAIVAMTELKNRTLDNGTVVQTADFDWSSELQGHILSSFFYGYILTQLIGGWLANRVGGHCVYGIGIGVTALLTLVTPALAKADVYLLLAVRVVEGIFEGVTYPCIHAVWARWAPPLERTKLATLAFSGSYVGTVVSMPICGLLAASVGWESIFYIFGAVGIVWFIFWWMVVKQSPEEDPYITAEELTYIQKCLGDSGKRNDKELKYPWKSIFTSGPVWAIVVAHTCENWGFYTLLTQLPKFMKDTLNFDISKAGLMSALPYLVMAIVLQFVGHFADWLRSRRILTTTQVRKSFNFCAFIAQTVFMLGAAFWMSPFGCMFCLTMAVGCGSFAWAAFSVNHLDIAPQYASVLMGLGNTFATLPGIISPTITGYIVVDKTAEQWRIVFFIASSVYLVGAIIFCMFASGEVQPWALEKPPSKERQRSTNGVANKAFENVD